MHEDLRTHVERRADEGREHLALEVIDGPRESEISELVLVAFDEDVLRLQIAVDDAVLEEIDESGEEVFEDLNTFLLGEVTSSFEFSSEVAPVAELLDDVVVVRCLEDVDEVNNVLTL